ncbi:MAG: translation initiation factor IF-2 [Candidatus Anstonellaceae archaeon]
MPLRQPIVVVMGHVDHGKTSLLDAIRSTNVAKKEAGAITQHIGASEVPLDSIKETCAGVLAARKMQFSIPGLLFIDTPGHESFTHLRERGGSIADIAVLVVDIAQGFQPQTIESIRILREFKTPFVVAANKVDLVTGWKSAPPESAEACSIISNIDRQKPEVQSRLDELLYALVGKLSEFGIASERFDRVEDFTRQVAIMPVSAKTGEGLPELLLSIAGLSQKFLENELKTEVDGAGKGSILELKEERGLGTTIDVIIYDGVLRKNDEIIFGTLNGPAKTKVRGLLKPKLQPTGEGDKFEYVDEVHAASGVKIYAPGLEGALSGSPLLVDDGKREAEQLREIDEMIKTIMFENDAGGVIVKADTLGSLEALHKLLTSQGVEIKRASVGKVSKKDVVDASVVAASDPYKGAVLSFSVEVGDDAEAEAAKTGVKIFSSKVIYSLCDDYAAWVAELKKKAAGEASERLPLPAKLLAMPGCTFRASKPAIFGVEILGGKLKKGVRLMTSKGEIVGEIREIQKEGKPVSEAKTGDQLAISVEGAICGKSFNEGDSLYVYIGRKDADELVLALGKEMSDGERAVLEEILAITDRRLI